MKRPKIKRNQCTVFLKKREKMFEMLFLHKPLTAGIAKTRTEHPRIYKKHSKALNTPAPQKPILARRAAVTAK